MVMAMVIIKPMKTMKKTVIQLFALLFVSVAFAAVPLDLGSAAGSTPYDRYMDPVKQVLSHLPTNEGPSMDRVRQLLREGRGFRYSFTDPYTAASPAVTAQTRSGDCKAKALWLLNGLGDSNALFVIGKTSRYSRTSHAWVYWRNENRWWILDCTNRTQPIAADSVSEERYIPYYSYGRSGEFRHRATQLLINPMSPNTGAPAVADRAAGQGGK